MRRQLNIVALVVFVLGCLIPAIHIAVESERAGSCCDDSSCDRQPPAQHDSSHCEICQLAQVPLVATPPLVAPPLVGSVAEYLPLPASVQRTRSAYRLPFSCGPPV